MEQEQKETTVKTKTSVGVVNVAVATLLMGASLVVASGIVMGLGNIKTASVKKSPPNVAVTEVSVDKNAFIPKTIDDGHASFMNFIGRLDVYNQGVMAGSLTWDGVWHPSDNVGSDVTEPLSIEVFLLQGMVTDDVPSQVITMLTDGGTITDLCYPGGKDVSTGDLKYYYDQDGMPYKDAALKNPVMTSKCTELLKNSYNPMDLIGGEVNTAYPDEVGEVGSTIRAWIVREGQSIGAYLGSEYGFNMKLWDDTYNLLGGNAPLSVSLGHFSEGVQTIPERMWKLTSDIGAHELCIPAVTVEPYTGSFFFYNQEGYPYADSLLTEAIACGPKSGKSVAETKEVTKDLDNSGEFINTLPDEVVE